MTDFPFFRSMTFQDQAESILKNQTATWSLATRNYAALRDIRLRDFQFGQITIRIQHNPARAVSSLAKTDRKTLAERPCFLCAQNRPNEQIGITLFDCYELLVNPFPIFTKHFTIASIIHEPQRLSQQKFLHMLELARLLPDYYLFYNGAHAGASAPDHFHFQAGNANFFPQSVEKVSLPFLCAKSQTTSSKEQALEWFLTMLRKLEERIQETEAHRDEEAMFNLFVRYIQPYWTLTIFPRRAHRPVSYHKGTLMISPGAVDMAGVLIAAREEDFLKITEQDIRTLYSQTSLIL